MFKERDLPYDYGLDLPSHMYASISTSLGGTNPAAALAANYDTLVGISKARQYGIDHASKAWGSVGTTQGVQSFRSTGNKLPKYNNCSNNKYVGCNYPFTICYRGYRNYLYIAYFMRTGAASMNRQVVRLTRHHQADIGSAQRSAWGTMQPRFEGDISMFNFIIELKDFKSLARFLLNKPLRKLSNMFKRLSKKRKFDLTKPIANLHLANEFALKPLISDIVTITNQISVIVSEAQQKFADAGTERNTRHYTQVFPISETQELSAYYQTTYPHILRGTSEQLTFTASMEYSYEYQMRGALSAFTKYWGLTGNVEGIWNALPFSFLVDYFLTVGKALQMNSRDKNVLLSTTQYCESLLSERTSGEHYKASSLFGPMLGQGFARFPNPIGNYIVSGANSSLYSRRVCHPTTWAVMPALKKPSSKQGWNMLALARCFF